MKLNPNVEKLILGVAVWLLIIGLFALVTHGEDKKPELPLPPVKVVAGQDTHCLIRSEPHYTFTVDAKTGEKHLVETFSDISVRLAVTDRETGKELWHYDNLPPMRSDFEATELCIAWRKQIHQSVLDFNSGRKPRKEKP